MKITDILDIADKVNANKDCPNCDIPFGECFDCHVTTQDFLLTAYPMESKLRSIVDILPEIKQTIQVYRNYRRDNDGNDTTGYYDDLLAKIEKWENE